MANDDTSSPNENSPHSPVFSGENTAGLDALFATQEQEIPSLSTGIVYTSYSSIGIIGSSGGPSDLHKGNSDTPTQNIYHLLFLPSIIFTEIQEEKASVFGEIKFIQELPSLEQQIYLPSPTPKSLSNPLGIIFEMIENKSSQTNASPTGSVTPFISMRPGITSFAEVEEFTRFIPAPVSDGAGVVVNENPNQTPVSQPNQTIISPNQNLAPPNVPDTTPPHSAIIVDFQCTQTVSPNPYSHISFGLSIPGQTTEYISELILWNVPYALTSIDIYVNGSPNPITIYPNPNAPGQYDLSAYASLFDGNPNTYISLPYTLTLLRLAVTTSKTVNTLTTTSQYGILDPVGAEFSRMPLDFSINIFTEGLSSASLPSLILSGIPSGDYIYLQNDAESSSTAYQVTNGTFNLTDHGWTPHSQVYTMPTHQGNYNLTLTGLVKDGVHAGLNAVTLVYPMNIVSVDHIPTIPLNNAQWKSNTASPNLFIPLISGTVVQLGIGSASDHLTGFMIYPGNALPEGLSAWSDIIFKATAIDSLGHQESVIAPYHPLAGQWVFHLGSGVIELQNLEIRGPAGFQGSLGSFYQSIAYQQGGISYENNLPDPFHIQVSGTPLSEITTISTQAPLSETTHEMHATDIQEQPTELAANSGVITPSGSFFQEEYTNPDDHSHLPDASGSASLYHEEGGNIMPLTSTTESLTIDLHTSLDFSSINIPREAHTFDLVDHMGTVTDSDIIQITGLLPGTSFFDFGQEGVLRSIGTVGASSSISLTGEQLHHSYFDSPLDIGKIYVGVKVTNYDHPDFNALDPLADSTAHHYEFTLDLSTNSTDSGFHGGDNPHQLHIPPLPNHDLLSLGMLDTAVYHLNDLGYLEMIHPQESSGFDLHPQQTDHHNTEQREEPAHLIATEPAAHVPSPTDQIGVMMDVNHHPH